MPEPAGPRFVLYWRNLTARSTEVKPLADGRWGVFVGSFWWQVADDWRRYGARIALVNLWIRLVKPSPWRAD
jgi:hypothetical protein